MKKSALVEAAPAAPLTAGVYYLLAADGELLYAGKAGNLRARLKQHAAAQRDRYDRLRALYRSVGAVRWEQCADEDAATAREADVIVALTPAFNAAIAYEGTWTYIGVGPAARGGGDVVRFSAGPCLPDDASSVYGCFPHLGPGVSSRPGNACTEGYASLLRLLWAASDARGPMPSRITRPSAPPECELAVAAEHRRSLHAFLSGTSMWLVAALLNDAAARREAYMRPGIERDAAKARGFFRYGPVALRALRLRRGVRGRVVSAEQFRALIADEVRDSIGDFVLPAYDED